jgi:hypothetical protein
MQPRLHLFRAAAGITVALLVVLAGCGGDSTGPGEDGLPAGSFILTVSGDVNREISGEDGGFWEVSDPQTQTTVWVLDLSTGDEQALEGLEILVGGSRLTVGEYTLSAADPDELESGEGVAFVVVNPSLDGSGFLGVSVSGSLKVTESAAGSVAGAIDLSAQGNVFPPGGAASPGQVLIRGDFRAPLTDPPVQTPIEPPAVNPD